MSLPVANVYFQYTSVWFGHRYELEVLVLGESLHALYFHHQSSLLLGRSQAKGAHPLVPRASFLNLILIVLNKASSCLEHYFY